MANLKASIKDIKKSRKKRERNLELKNKMKKTLRELKDAVKAGAEKEKIGGMVVSATKVVDKAAKARIIHKNNASRKKSMIDKLVEKKEAK